MRHSLYAKNIAGFSLIELMVVVAIIALLATIAAPAYNQYTLRGKRAEGRAALLDAAATLERFYSDNNRYATADNTLAASVSTTSETGKYAISITTASPYQTYTLRATTVNFTDDDCGYLELTHAGAKSAELGGADCWSR